jgi:hypothetical protein
LHDDFSFLPRILDLDDDDDNDNDNDNNEDGLVEATATQYFATHTAFGGWHDMYRRGSHITTFESHEFSGAFPGSSEAVDFVQTAGQRSMDES